DDVGAGGRVGHGRPHQLLDGGIVGDVVTFQNAAVAVRGVFAQAHIGDDDGVGSIALDGANRRLNRRIVVVGGRSDVIFVRGDAEQQDARYAFGACRCA